MKNTIFGLLFALTLISAYGCQQTESYLGPICSVAPVGGTYFSVFCSYPSTGTMLSNRVSFLMMVDKTPKRIEVWRGWISFEVDTTLAVPQVTECFLSDAVKYKIRGNLKAKDELYGPNPAAHMLAQ